MGSKGQVIQEVLDHDWMVYWLKVVLEASGRDPAIAMKVG